MGRSSSSFDVVVIGGGHAGCEAAYAAVKRGMRVALVSMDQSKIGFMSCNPAIGGLGKGHLVKEVDALGGLMARVTDLTAIQMRRLNTSKGPAVRASRAQCDKLKYAAAVQAWLTRLTSTGRFEIVGAEADEILTGSLRVTGVRLRDGSVLSAKSVIVTSGTFLRGLMHTGEDKVEGGRVGDAASKSLSQSLVDLGFSLRRLKTGTPPRLHRKSIDFSKLKPQPGDTNPEPMSFFTDSSQFPVLPQIECFLTYTNAMTHRVIEDNLTRSPMYSGAITGVGPRYCPSIEDKVVRFRDKEKHQIFLEPEGLDVDEVYVNGVSTSLPADIQEKFICTIEGLQNAVFMRHGYAVEYDAVDARFLKATFESKDIQGLFTAGQVNGTSGYEEAAAQGLIAGINAAQHVLSADPFILGRDQGYTGVMIDDLVLKGSDEPYRMFTSRAEHRLLLREDNADLRLSERAYRLGLLNDAEFSHVEQKIIAIERISKAIKESHLLPNEVTNAWVAERGMPPLKDRVSAEAFLRRPEVTWRDLFQLNLLDESENKKAAEQVEIQVKYAGYIERDQSWLKQSAKQESTRIPIELEFESVPGLSNEIKGRLKKTRPETIGQMSRIQGVTPAAVANMIIHLKTTRKPEQSANEQQRF